MDLKQALLRSGICLDTVTALRLYLRGLRVPVVRQLLIAARIRFTPDILGRILHAGLGAGERSLLFSEAMNLFRSGPTFKTTGAGRTPLTDRAILAKAGPEAVILEAGVSDGVSALGLLEARGGRGVLLSDRQAAFHYSAAGPFRVFYDRDDGLLSFKLLFIYICTGLPSGGPPPGAREASLLNPDVRERFPEARLAPFDIFSDALPEKADVIKCANVLNKAYFPPARAKDAAANLLRSLKEGGRLYISQSNQAYRDSEAYIALRREGGTFVIEEEVNGHELLPHMLSGEFSGVVRQDRANL